MAMKAMLALDLTLFKAGERVCVAVSGGADSTALLLGLVDACAAKDGLGVVLSAAHIHHGLRGAEADLDEAFVADFCARTGVALRVFHVDTAARQSAEHEGLEEAARALRYEALRGLMKEGLVDVVATGHTLDDQAETVVMKLLRGAWTEGLGGISPEVQGPGGSGHAPGRIVRPLLDVRRLEIEAYLHARGQGWREDSSNRDLGLTRNKVRHVLMPLLRDFNPGVDALLARTAEIARAEEAFWRSEMERLLPQVLLPGKPVRGGGRAVGTAVGEASCALELTRLAAMPSALRRRIVRGAAAAVGRRLSSEETAKVLALAGFEGAGGLVKGRIGSRLELSAGTRVERSARELRFWRQA